MAEVATKPKVYYDIKTTNESFLKVSAILKSKGVRNYSFPLMIYDPTLIGVDPWSDEVAKDINLQARITIEIERNVWYFLREVIRIPASGSSVKYEIHVGNLAMTFMMLMNVNTAIELPRQHYKTYSAVAFYLWVVLFKSKNYSMLFTHKSYDDATENLRKLRLMLDPKNDGLPEWLLPTLDSTRDKDNETELLLGENNNRTTIVSPANSKDQANKAGKKYDCPDNLTNYH